MEYSNKSTHDEVNLARLLRRLEKSTADPSWSNDDNESGKWLKAVDMLQKVKYARSLLKNMELYDFDPTPASAKRYYNFRTTLDTIDAFAKDVEMRVAPQPKPLEPLLPTIPIPKEPELVSEPEPRPEPSPAPATDNLLLSPSEPPPPIPIPTLLPPSATTPAKSSGISPQFLQNTNALHDELTGQLEQMAAQLLRNARHFNDSLAKDQAVVEDTQQKLESNFDVAKKERIRLRDHRGKSGMTTCWVVGAVVVVTFLFILMVMLIRLT
ncbi:hypothetical protein BDZ89DRAFT_1058332 [Hymenopellis radicata]|nr:hypothetical protein BDZ89DRAFT_1058332 [Hymenopellis radicata]